MVIMTQERSSKVVNVMTLGTGFLALGCSHISHIVKMLYFFKNPLLYSFHDPMGSGVDQIMYNFDDVSQYTAH